MERRMSQRPAATIEICSEGHLPDWAILRAELWPDGACEDHQDFAAAALAQPQRLVAFLARADTEAVGFAEASLRHDYVNGCSTSPVGFLEGLYVRGHARGRGIARALVTAVEQWVRERGCSELASDALLDNEQSHAVYRTIGFIETERVVYFLKPLGKVAAQ